MKWIAGLAVLFVVAHTQALTLDSGTRRPTTVELYTSEGCSSCPPADRWLSGLRLAPGLFDDLIPMAFHVDYWDRLGWRDPYGSVEFSQRQRQHYQQGNVERVYTPGFVVDNREWRGFFRRQRLAVDPTENAGRLQVDINTDSRRLRYRYKSSSEVSVGRVLHVAYLMMGVCGDIGAGENRGQQLCHDFVVSRHRQQAMAGNRALTHFHGELILPMPPDSNQRRTALVVWVSQGGSIAIEQAVAAYLPAARL